MRLLVDRLYFNYTVLSQVQHYILVVQAQDSGHPSLSSTITCFVNVLDKNDNAPAFDPMSYSNEILENVTVGTDVMTVSATDIDSGKNIYSSLLLLLWYTNRLPTRLASEHLNTSLIAKASRQP